MLTRAQDPRAVPIQRQRFALREEQLAALAAVGALGLGYVELPRWCRERAKPIGWQLPPAILRRDPLLAVAQDATSGIFVPATGAEWSTLLPSYTAPSHIWLAQEASGNLADSIGTANLVPTGAGTANLAYQQTETGWTRKSVRCTLDATTAQWLSTDASLPNIGTTSALSLIYCSFPVAAPAGTRVLAQMGTSTVLNRITSGPRFQIVENGTAVSGTVSPLNAVRPMWALHDVTNLRSMGATNQEIISTTYSGVVTGKSHSFIGGGAVAPLAGWLYGTLWQSTAAELTNTDVGLITSALGWSRTWTIAQTASLSESAATSESTAVQVQCNIALTETDATSESLGSAASLSIGLFEIDATSESLTGSRGVAVSLAESASLAESLASLYAAITTLSEAVATVEALTLTKASTIGLSELAATSEALTGSVAIAIGLAESAATSESTSVQAQATVALAETDATSESLAITKAATIALADNAAIAEVLGAAAHASASLVDALAIAEQVTGSNAITVALVDAQSVSNAIAVHLSANVTLSDAVAILEQLGASILRAGSILGKITSLGAVRGKVTKL